MSGGTLHQILVGVAPHDAVTDQTLLMQRWLREAGYRSEVYAYHIHPEMADRVRPLATYRQPRGEKQVIFHHSIGSEVIDRVLELDARLLLVYHNITPPRFFANTSPYWASQMQNGLDQLAALQPKTGLALADSPFNAQELKALGFRHTTVVPITFDSTDYQLPPVAEIVAQQGAQPTLLFVGRIGPNKRQEDLIKLLYFYRRLEPAARLVLVGAPWQPAYLSWLEALAAHLGVEKQLLITGRATQAEMASWYQTADVYVSMSEHEGFGKPLLESMYFGLPVVAYDATAVPYTLGEAGILFREKNYAALAELLMLLQQDASLRQRIIERQQRRLADFAVEAVRARFLQAVAGELA